MKAMKIAPSAVLALLMFGLCSCASRRVARQEALAPAASELVQSLTQIQLPPVENQTPSGEKKNEPLTPVSQQTFGTWENGLRIRLDSLCNNDSLAATSQIGIEVFDLTQGAPLYARNAHHRMRPASCQKLVTAIAALHYLSPEHVLRTQLRMSGRVSGGTLQGNLYIVGGMDPMVTPEEVDALVRVLAASGIKRVNGNICKDLSMAQVEPYGWGWCWDDDYGPLSPLMVDGKDRFSAQWMRSMARHGIGVSGADTLVASPCPADAAVLGAVEHGVKPLLYTMMKESDNIYAESLFYQLAACAEKAAPGRKQIAKMVTDLMEEWGIGSAATCVADGSGLSLYNYTTPHTLVALLQAAHSRPQLYNALLESLPIAGVDGTLKKRMLKGNAHRRVWAKTGSVSGVSSLSGYAQAPNGHLLAFCIMNQGVVRTAHGRDFQDKICEILCGGRQ